MKRAIALFIVIWVVFYAVLLAIPYGSDTTQNAGIWWPLPPHHHCGFEYRGSIGFFCDVD